MAMKPREDPRGDQFGPKPQQGKKEVPYTKQGRITRRTTAPGAHAAKESRNSR